MYPPFFHLERMVWISSKWGRLGGTTGEPGITNLEYTGRKEAFCR